ncbi:hypothetical protein ACFQY5_41070 [Paeniroseomonas aquatica]
MTDPDGAGPRPQSAHTQRAYATDCAAFAGWCAAVGEVPLPASPRPSPGI